MSISRLDLWIAATMPSDPALERWLARAGVASRDLDAVRAEAQAAGLTSGMIDGPARVAAFFGPPAVVTANRLTYPLALWPAHEFIWAVSRWGDACAVGMRLRVVEAVAPLATRDPDAVRAALRVWHHTEHEVRCALGAPDEPLGDRWLYATSNGRHRLAVDFAWGLLRETRLERVPVRAPAVPAAALFASLPVAPAALLIRYGASRRRGW